MSLNVNPLPIVEALDPRIRINNVRAYDVLRGGSELSYQAFPSSSFTNSTAQFTCNPPNQNVVVSRYVLIKNQYEVKCTGADAGVPLYQSMSVAPRATPIASTTNTVQFSINNSQVSTNLNQYLPIFHRYHNAIKTRDVDDSTTPAQLDQYQDYADWKTYGSARNIFAQYGENSAEMSRNAFPYAITASSNTAFTMTFTVTEPIMLSPFISAKDSEMQSGFIGVQTMAASFTWSDLNRVISYDATTNGALTTISTELKASSLLFNYITPPLVSPIPPVISYPYFEIIPYPTAGPTLAAGASATVSMSAVQLKGIPRRLYVFARERDQDLSYTKPDVYARISNVVLNWNNKTGQLASASEQDLFEMSRKNGCNLSWPQWSKFVGSVLCLEMGTDVPLTALEAPGIIGNFQLNMQVTMQNLSTRSINYTLYVVAVGEGTLTITNGSVLTQIGVLSQQNVLDASEGKVPQVPYQAAEKIHGGNFFSDVGNFFTRDIPKAYGAVAPHVKSAIDIGRAVAPLLGGVGSGGVGSGGVLMGGARASRARLRSRAM